MRNFMKRLLTAANDNTLNILGAGGATLAFTLAIPSELIKYLCSDQAGPFCDNYSENTHLVVALSAVGALTLNAILQKYACQTVVEDQVAIHDDQNDEQPMNTTGCDMKTVTKKTSKEVNRSLLRGFGAGGAIWAFLYAIPNELVKYLCSDILNLTCDSYSQKTHLFIGLAATGLFTVNAMLHEYVCQDGAQSQQEDPKRIGKNTAGIQLFVKRVTGEANDLNLQIFGAGGAIFANGYGIPTAILASICSDNANDACDNYSGITHFSVTLALIALSTANAAIQQYCYRTEQQQPLLKSVLDTTEQRVTIIPQL